MTLILRAANEGASMSGIMYEVYLSSRPLKRYLNFMVESGLLSYDETARQYSVTPKGLDFLSVGERMLPLIWVDEGTPRRRERTGSIEVREKTGDATIGDLAGVL